MILKKFKNATVWVAFILILISTTNIKAQSNCKNTTKMLAPYLEEMLKGTNNKFYTPRDTHDYVISLTQKLPEGEEEKEALLKERYFKYLEDTEADLKTLRNTLRTKGILPSNLRISGAVASESQVVKSNRPKGPFAVHLPKDEQIHLEITSALFVVDNNTGSYSKRMLINAYILEDNGHFSLMKIDSNPVSDLSNYETLIKNIRVKFPELLSYTYLVDDNFKNIHIPGKKTALVQVNGEGSTTVLIPSDEHFSVFGHQTPVQITLAEGIARAQLPKAINEIQGALSLYGKGIGYDMNLFGSDKEKNVKFTYDFISMGAFRKDGNGFLKHYSICYEQGDYGKKSMPARLIISPDENGTYRMDLIAGKQEE